ncbi:ABC transporter substrate-binding protein [Kineococcus sp. SYSU DK005]|uniref:ABC transporter substrate-binding protein n=1 Tax=Kineococcus sp. SYSU DK005 TaxID=3383126 RepID=UPI003D7DE353
MEPVTTTSATDRGTLTRRAVVGAGIATAATAALSACGGSSGTGGDGPATLRFILSGDTTQGGGYAAMAKKYQEQTGVVVEINDVPYDDLVTKLRNAVQAGDLPALARASSVDPLWVSALQDLKDVATSRNVMPSLLAEDEDGQVLALPSDLTAVGLFLNKTLFDAAGVAFPTTVDDTWSWDEFVADLRQVQAAGARYGLVVDPSAHRLRSFLYEFGSRGVEENPDGTFTMNEQTAPALEYFKKLHDDGVVPTSVWLSGDDASALFKSGQVAAYYSGVWQVTDFTQNVTDFEWVSAPLPKQPVQATNLGTNWIVAFDGSGVEEEAKKFVDWLYTAENYAELSTVSGFLPAVEDVEVQYAARPEAFELYNAEIAASDDICARQVTDSIKNSYADRGMENEPLKDEVVKYLNGEQDVATTIRRIEEATTQALSA